MNRALTAELGQLIVSGELSKLTAEQWAMRPLPTEEPCSHSVSDEPEPELVATRADDLGLDFSPENLEACPAASTAAGAGAALLRVVPGATEVVAAAGAASPGGLAGLVEGLLAAERSPFPWLASDANGAVAVACESSGRSRTIPKGSALVKIHCGELDFDVKAVLAKQKPVSEGESGWETDADATDCKQCKSAFGAFRYKYHCEQCGKIFCDDCTKGRHTIGSKDDCRVCNECKETLESGIEGPLQEYKDFLELIVHGDSSTTSGPIQMTFQPPAKEMLYGSAEYLGDVASTVAAVADTPMCNSSAGAAAAAAGAAAAAAGLVVGGVDDLMRVSMRLPAAQAVAGA